MPLERMSMKVTMKLTELAMEAIQKMPMERIQRFCPVPSPGPASFPTALIGGYAVQPEIGGPSLTNNVARRTRKAASVVQNDSMFTNGNAVSSAPI